MTRRALAILVVCTGAWLLSAPTGIEPVVRTDRVQDDPDDPAIWVHPSDPARSLILGTNKVKAPNGAVLVFGLDGKTRQTVAGIDRPNNVDVEYGLALGGARVDVAVATERLKGQLRVFRVSAEGIADITSEGNTRVFVDRSGEQAAPMGVGVYRRARDGAIFAIVSPKSGPRENYLGQYLLSDDGKGRVRATFVRYFGAFSGKAEIEAVAVDDALGHVYYADEDAGIRQYSADPDARDAGRELAWFGRTGFQGNHEGIGIYARKDGTGFIVCTDQLPGSSEYRVYRREGAHELVKVVRGGADSTDGLEVTSRAVGPRFPAGMIVAMNSSGKNFLVYRWEDVERAR